MATLESRFNEMKSTLREILSKQKYLCVTADVWSSRAQSYLGITVHFLDEMFVRNSYLLAFKELEGRQTYSKLALAINEVFADYGIKKNQITNIVTDGGSAFCKMFKVFGTGIDPTIIEQNEVINDEISEEIDVIRPFMEDVNGELFASDILDLNAQNTPISDQPNDFDSYLNGIDDLIEEPQIELPKQRRCVSHLLNCLSKAFTDKLPRMPKSTLVLALNKLHPLWVLTHRSSRAKTICKEVLGKCLLMPCETRWNSTYDAVKRCSSPEIQPKLNKLIEALQKADIAAAKNMQPINAQDFSVLTSYLKVMEPVAISLDRMQSEFNGSQGNILPVLISMNHHIENLRETSNIIKDFKKCMLEIIKERFSKYLSIEAADYDLVLAAITLPQYKTTFIASDEAIIYAKELLTQECKKMAREIHQNISTEPHTSSAQDVTDDFIISFATQRNNRRASLENDIESEVARFFVDSRTDMKILHEYPHVKEVYFKYNTTLSSSAPVERVFSQSMMIFTPRRNRISSKNFEMALLSKVNRSLLKNTHKEKK